VAWLQDDVATGAPPRVAFAVGRRVGGAVERNAVRRRLRAIAREAALPAGTWLVRAGPGAAGASYAELSSWVRGAAAALSGVPA
jgi:ribonuclease P protein component